MLTSVLLDRKYYQVQAAEHQIVKHIPGTHKRAWDVGIRPKFMGKARKRFNGIDHLGALLQYYGAQGYAYKKNSFEAAAFSFLGL